MLLASSPSPRTLVLPLSRVPGEPVQLLAEDCLLEVNHFSQSGFHTLTLEAPMVKPSCLVAWSLRWDISVLH